MNMEFCHPTNANIWLWSADSQLPLFQSPFNCMQFTIFMILTLHWKLNSVPSKCRLVAQKITKGLMSTANKELINAISMNLCWGFLHFAHAPILMRSDFVATKMNSPLPTESYNFFLIIIINAICSKLLTRNRTDVVNKMWAVLLCSWN